MIMRQVMFIAISFVSLSYQIEKYIVSCSPCYTDIGFTVLTRSSNFRPAGE